MMKSTMLFSAIVSLLNMTAARADDLTAGTFKNPPNEYRITQYQLTPDTLKQYPEYGIGGTMAFFYSLRPRACGFWPIAYTMGWRGPGGLRPRA